MAQAPQAIFIQDYTARQQEGRFLSRQKTLFSISWPCLWSSDGAEGSGTAWLEYEKTAPL